MRRLYWTDGWLGLFQKMSFFNSLQQMVSSGVANLTLSPKRFSFSKESTGSQGSEDEPAPGPSPSGRSVSS